MLGSVSYTRVYTSQKFLRIDSGEDTSLIINKTSGEQIFLDHNLRIFREQNSDAPTQEASLQFVKAVPFQQKWNNFNCEVFVYEQTEGENPLHISLWFSDFNDVETNELLSYFLGSEMNDTVFPEKTPTGFPVRVIVRMKIDGAFQDTVNFTLENFKQLHIKPDRFEIPPSYQKE